MKLKDIVKMERIKRGWTLEEVGEKIQKSHNAIWHYEKGTRTIDSETLEKYGELFGYEWRKTGMENQAYKTVRELYNSLPDEQAYQSLGKFYYSWKAEKLRESEQKLCKDINEQLGLYGYRLKDREEAGTYNDIIGYMNMEIVLVSEEEEIDFQQKEDVLIQNPNDLSYVALCNNGVFRYKVQLDGSFKEVITIEKQEQSYLLTTYSPLIERSQHYGYVEECFYRLIETTLFKLNYEEKQKVLRYFEEE
jgi:transcriptional regulator with XRE-family HTH domain